MRFSCSFTGCPSIQHCMAEVSHHFLLPSVLTEIVNLVSSLASDTTVKVFERTRCVPDVFGCICICISADTLYKQFAMFADSCPQGDIHVPLSNIQHISQPPTTSRTFILIGRNFSQWHCSTEQGTSFVETAFISALYFTHTHRIISWLLKLRKLFQKYIIMMVIVYQDTLIILVVKPFITQTH